MSYLVRALRGLFQFFADKKFFVPGYLMDDFYFSSGWKRIGSFPWYFIKYSFFFKNDISFVYSKSSSLRWWLSCLRYSFLESCFLTLKRCFFRFSSAPFRASCVCRSSCCVSKGFLCDTALTYWLQIEGFPTRILKRS